MRFATKSTIALLALYFITLGGLAFWLEYQMRSMANTLMEGTARLVGGEIATAMSESALDQLLHADPTARQRLEQILANLSARSDVVASIAVVDETGKVVASDDITVGRQLAIPEAIFQGSQRAQFLASRVPLEGGKYHLFVPLVRAGTLVGYVRLSLSSHRISNLYHRAQRQLLMAAGAGLTFVAALGFLFHIQLTRRSAALARALEGAMRGEAVPIRHGRDEFARTLQVARKVGEELSEAREKSFDAERRFGALMKVMDVGVVLLNPEHGLEFANAPARELLGFPAAGELEQHWDEIGALVVHTLDSVDASGVRLDLDIPGATHPNRLRLEIYPHDEEARQGYLVLVKSREMQDALENELRLAIQMRGFARFYMAFAHDLKAPLNAMVLNLELLKSTLQRQDPEDDDAPRGRQARYVAVLSEELARLDRYLRTVLTQAAPPSETQQQFNLCDLIQDLATLLSPQAKQQQVDLKVRVPEGSLPYVGHRDRLKQAMLNIAINALESMPTGGRMSIALDTNDGHAQIAIRDSGPGIPKELLGEIYGMHFTTKNGGTGIGLYVARSVVQAHGGDIHVASEIGRGTCFQVDLPLLPA